MVNNTNYLDGVSTPPNCDAAGNPLRGDVAKAAQDALNSARAFTQRQDDLNDAATRDSAQTLPSR